LLTLIILFWFLNAGRNGVTAPLGRMKLG